DRGFHRLQPREAVQVGGHYGGAEAGHAAGAGDRTPPRAPRIGIERVEAGDEGAAVREVDVVHAAGQGRARDRVIAALERAGSVDQQVDAGGREGCGEVRGIEVQA